MVLKGVFSVEQLDILQGTAPTTPEEPYFTAPTESVKLAPLLLSQVAGGNSPGSSCTWQLPGIVLERAIGSCTVTTVNLGGVQVCGLLDSRSQVSTITESFFNQHFRPRESDLLDTSKWLTLTASNGLEISYISYLELDFEALGVTFP